MNRRRAGWLLVLVLLVLALGLWRLFAVRLSGGDLFPPYSTFRADPIGSRALYAALEEMPGFQVQRWLRSIRQWDATTPATIVLAGMNREAWTRLPAGEAEALDAAAKAGSRVVVLFAAELTPEKLESEPKQSAIEQAGRKQRERQEAKRLLDLPPQLRPADWERLWSIRVNRRRIFDGEKGAVFVGTSSTLPSSVPWKSDLYFAGAAAQSAAQPAVAETSSPEKAPTDTAPRGDDGLAAAGWKVLYSRGHSPVLIERRRGRGTVVLASDAYLVSNEALRDNPHSDLLLWFLQGPGRVVFCETQLGVREDLGVAALARRYGLGGLALMLLALAALYIWQQAVRFVPPPVAADDTLLTYSQTAGLEALLQRAIPPNELLSSCVGEWQAGARRTDVARVQTALESLPKNATPVEGYNAAAEALRRK